VGGGGLKATITQGIKFWVLFLEKIEKMIFANILNFEGKCGYFFGCKSV
jgi:hypothetical protein